MSVRERCSCGSQFESNEPDCVKLWREWRKKHVCVHTMQDEAKDSGSVSSSLEAVSSPHYPELRIGFRADEEE